MAYDDEKGRAGKRIFWMVEADLDYCQETYGTAPCTAALGVTGTRKCFNTFETCQDTANYNPAPKTYRFTKPQSGVPRALEGFPLLRSIDTAPTTLDPGNSLGKRAAVSVELQDAPHHDRGIDKYVDERSTGAAVERLALSFDGANDRVTFAEPPGINGTDTIFTVEGWITPEDNGDTFAAIITPTSAGRDQYIWWDPQDEDVNVGVAEAANTNQKTVSSGVGSVPTGETHHFAVVVDEAQGQLSIYIDGQLAANQAWSDPIADWSSTWYVGERGGLSQWWYEGLITELRIWNYPRSLAEISTNWRRRLTSASDLAADPTTTTAADRVRSYNGTLNGPVWVGRGPQDGLRASLSFDGADDYVDFGAISYDWNADDWTVEIFSRSIGDASTYRGMVGNRFGAGSANWWTLGTNTSGHVVVETGGGAVEYANTGYVANGKGWQKWAVVKSGTTITIYRNGVQAAQRTITGNVGDETNELRIGRWLTAAQAWEGEQTELRLWSTARTAAEIQSTLDRRLDGDETGLFAYWPLDDGIGLVAYYPCDEGEGTTLTDNAGSQDGTIDGASWSGDGPLSLADPDEVYDPIEQGTFFGRLRARNPFYLGRTLRLYNGFLPWSHDRDPSEQTALDQSVQTAAEMVSALDFTFFGGPLSWSDARNPATGVRGYLTFDGGDDYVNAPHDASLQVASLTLEGWVRLKTANGDSFPRIFQKGQNTSYELYMSNQTVYSRLRTPTDGTNDLSLGDLTVGEWKHLAVTYDETTGVVRSYANGVEFANETRATAEALDTDTEPVRMGVRASAIGSDPEEYLHMDVTDWRVWDHVRTPSQIQGNMNRRLAGDESGLVGYWPLNDGVRGYTEAEVLANLQKREYVLERFEGPNSNGGFRMVAKDILKLADDDRAQAPRPSTGTLSANITAGASSATLTPSGVGNDEYPSSGRCKIGDEIIDFTRSGDTLTLVTRGDLNTTASSHEQDDTVQVIYQQEGAKPSAIVEDLLDQYTSVDTASYITTADWTDEDDTYIGRLYTGYVVEPTPVRQLINELSQQAGFFVWWDELDQQIRFRAVRQPEVPALSLGDDDAILENSVKQKEQPEKRRSQVWVYHGLLRPTDDLDKARNYAAVYVLKESDKESSNAYGRQAITKVFARWISQTNRPAAEEVAQRINARYQDPPRRVKFTTGAVKDDVETGDVFLLTTRLLQGVTGAPLKSRMLALSKESNGEGQWDYDAEEFYYVPPADAGTKRVVITADINDFKARDEFDLIYASVDASDVVEFEIQSGVIVGADNASGPAFDMQSWPAGVTITVVNKGTISGCGGQGGGTASNAGTDGQDGGTALYTRFGITVDNTLGTIQGGGGGGGGCWANNTGSGVELAFVGGGGAGRNGGAIGVANDGNRLAWPQLATAGTFSAGGQGDSTDGVEAGDAGNIAAAGDPGADTGFTAGPVVPGSGGAAGNAVDGDSYITYSGTGTITGAQVN